LLPWNINTPNPQFSKAHLRNLNFSKFKIIEPVELKNYCVEVPLNGIASVPNFTKIYEAVQKLLVGDTDRFTERLGDLISLLSLWKVG
jgi:hypothetical protein